MLGPRRTQLAPWPDMTVHAAPTDTTSHVSVSGELADLLIELSSALQKACLYRPGHPMLAAAAHGIVRRMAERRGHRGTLCVAESEGALIVEIRPVFSLTRRFEGVTTSATHPLLHALAERLRQHRIGEIALAEGVTPEEMAAILGLLATDPERTGRPLGHAPGELLESLPHVHLRSADDGAWSDGDEEDDDDGAPESGAPGPSPGELSELWREFARDALGLDPSEEDRACEPGELARALDIRSGQPAFDHRMSGHLARILRTLSSAGPLEELAARRQLSSVLRQLEPRTLRCILNMIDDDRLRREFLSHAAHALDVDVVLALVRTAAEDEESDISRWLLRLLSKMARHASREDHAVLSQRSSDALREQVQALLAGWDLENPNPEEYEEALASMSADSATAGAAAGSRTDVEPERVVQLSLETGVPAPALWRSVDGLVGSDRVAELVGMLIEAPTGCQLTEGIWNRLASGSILRRLIEEEDPDFETLDFILPHARMAAAEPLLDRLAAAESLSVRRFTYDRLRSLGSEVGPMAVQRIGRPEESPWFVLRNMLALLAALEKPPVDFDPSPLARHENPQVRHEALRLCLQTPALRDRAVVEGLGDDFPRTVALTAAAAAQACPPEAEPHLARLALDEEEDTQLRTLAIRGLAHLDTPGALDVLLRISTPRRRLLRSARPEATPELLAALRGLAEKWAADSRAAAVLHNARCSGDPRLAEAAS